MVQALNISDLGLTPFAAVVNGTFPCAGRLEAPYAYTMINTNTLSGLFLASYLDLAVIVIASFAVGYELRRLIQKRQEVKK